jgi:hypothetical protein
VNAETDRILRIERAILHQFAKSLPHRGSADAQSGRPVAILQARAGGKVADDQGGPKMLVDLRMQRGTLTDRTGQADDG